MKANFFILLICSWFLSIGNISAQTTVDFSFKIWKNSVYMGMFTGTASTLSGSSYYVTTNPMLGQLCPGDQLTIQQNCAKNSAQLNFNTSSHAQIGLTNSAQSGASVHPIATVCPVSPNPCVTGAQNFNSWTWNSTVTITLPMTPSYNNYLAIGTGIFGNSIPSTVCGTLVAFIPLTLSPPIAPISNQTICPGDVVNLGLNPNYTYSNWNPSNPDGTSLTSNTNYTVDVTNTNGCSINDAFTINVHNPDAELISINHLCYNQSIQITENDFFADGSPKAIYVNQTLIADNTIGLGNLPHIIDGPTYGSGPVTIEYVYYSNTGNGTCSKTYNLTIHPQIELNTQSTYAFCSNNFQQICATTSGTAQAGITYIWRKSGVPFAVGSGVCFTPSSYGTYFVTGYDEFGCEERRSFTVYDPGVGIKHPANITFCSLTQRGPRYIGWAADPFGLIRYSFTWTYTSSITNTTVSIVNTGAQYQVPYMGPGTYTAVVNANGCTETISIIVTDLLQVYNNSSNASFGFTPLWGNQVSCQPNTNMSGVNNIWTVTDQWNNNIPTTPYQNGVKFSYTTGVSYTVTLRREAPSHCQVFINQFTWIDGPNKSGKGTSRSNLENTSNNSLATATTMKTFPNPTSGLFNVRLTDAETSTTSIQVLNTLGQVILEKEVKEQNNIAVDLSKEITGVYIIQVINGDSKFTEKIIKQ